MSAVIGLECLAQAARLLVLAARLLVVVQ